jgi:hypothetical protein
MVLQIILPYHRHYYYSVVILFRITAKIVPLASDSSQLKIMAIKVCAEEDSAVWCGKAVACLSYSFISIIIIQLQL